MRLLLSLVEMQGIEGHVEGAGDRSAADAQELDPAPFWGGGEKP